MAVEIHVWSDVVCPWCFVGKRRLERAIAELGEAVSVQWHSFELDPNRTNETLVGVSSVERLAKKYSKSVAEAQEMVDRMRAVAAKEGLSFSGEGSQTLQSFDAHRLLQWAAECGRQSELCERLFAAQWLEAIDCGNPEELARLAGEAGLDETEAARVLASDRYAKEVREDEATASDLGIRGVPFFVIGRYAVSGAQSSEVLLQALDRAFVAEGEPESAAEVDAASAQN